MGSHDSFGHLKHKLWPKERPGIKLAVWFPTIKSRESTQFPCVQVACDILLKSSRRGLQLYLYLISIEGLHTKLWGPKVARVPTLAILGVSRQKCHLDVGLMERHKVYYKGEGGSFPQVRAVLSLVSPSLPVARLSTKSPPTNQLVIWFCVIFCEWISVFHSS
jgi:hypothetical protein